MKDDTKNDIRDHERVDMIITSVDFKTCQAKDAEDRCQAELDIDDRMQFPRKCWRIKKCPLGYSRR